MTAEHDRLEENRTGAATGWRGARTSASASGAPCARTTAPAGTPGTTSRTTRRARAPTAGARTASRHQRRPQRLCFSLALWNGVDPILKERMFGLTNSEGNHGEDVKEYWFYLDSTPTHSYMKMLYKYPQREFPYDDLVATNGRAQPRRVRVRADRHRHLRREPLLRRLRRVRQGRARRHPHRGDRAQPRSRRGDAAPAADAVVSQHWAWGSGGAAPSLEPRRPATPPACAPPTPSWAMAAVLRRLGRAAVLRERDEQRAPLRRAQRRGRTSRTASTTTSCDGGPTPSTPRARAPRRRRCTSSCWRPARAPACALRLMPRRPARAGAEPLGAEFDACWRRGAPRPTSSTRRSSPRRSTRTRPT